MRVRDQGVASPARHRSIAQRTSLRTSGSGSSMQRSSRARARGSAISPSAAAASLRKLLTSEPSASPRTSTAAFALIRPRAFATLVRTCQTGSVIAAISLSVAAGSRTFPIEAAACSRTCQFSSSRPARRVDTPGPCGLRNTKAAIVARRTLASGSLAALTSAGRAESDFR
jgi:hypothetical protein